MKSVAALNLGFSDAQNYTQRGNKQMLASVFVRNSYLDDLLKPNIYFLIGEKGTGKTAYAAFLNNNEYGNHKSLLKFINGTDYEKFYELKRTKRIDISGYVDIWKTILLLLLSKSVTEKEIQVSPLGKNCLPNLLRAIDEYHITKAPLKATPFGSTIFTGKLQLQMQTSGKMIQRLLSF